VQCVAVCCSVLQCVAVCCSALQCVVRGVDEEISRILVSVLKCVAVCCSVWQCSTVCYMWCRWSDFPQSCECIVVCGSVLQRCSGLPSVASVSWVFGGVLQCVTVCCSVLQCVAMFCGVVVYCSALQWCYCRWCRVLRLLLRLCNTAVAATVE